MQGMGARRRERCNVDHIEEDAETKKRPKRLEGPARGRVWTIAKPGGNPTLANLSFLRGCVSEPWDRGKAQKSTRTVPQLCERGKAGARRGRRGRRGNRAEFEQELQPSTTRERRKSPAGGASTLPTPVRTKARSGVETSEKLKTTVANNDLVWSPTRGKRLVTAPPPSSTKQAKKNTKLQHEDQQSGCSPRDRQSLRKKSSSTNTKTSPRSHRLSSQGAYLWETPSPGRFTTVSDGGRLFLNLFTNKRVARADQRIGAPTTFWNLKFGEQYDVTHPVNLRRVLRDTADGWVLGCMMSVPSAGWNVARDCSRPFRSSAQPWRTEKSRVSMSPSDLASLDTGNLIMRTVIKLARQRSALPCTVGGRESRKISLLDDITVAGAVKDAPCVQNDLRFLCFWYQMAKTYNSSGKSRPTCGLSTQCAVVDANDAAVLLVRNTCNSLGTTPLINVPLHSEAERIL